MSKHLVLVGLMGSGKSTIARVLHRKLPYAVYELDNLIEQSAGQTIAEIFATKGEEYFRQLERETLEKLIPLEAGIVSTGGGTFVRPENQRVLLENGWVFYLHGTAAELAKRIPSTATRPLLQGREKGEVLEELYRQRHPEYQRAHFEIRTDHRTAQEVAEEILRIYQKKTFLQREVMS